MSSRSGEGSALILVMGVLAMTHDDPFIAGLAGYQAARMAKATQVGLEEDLVSGNVGSLPEEVVALVCAPRTVAEVLDRHRAAAGPRTFDEIRRFARTVWAVERPDALPLQVTQVETLPGDVRQKGVPHGRRYRALGPSVRRPTTAPA